MKILPNERVCITIALVGFPIALAGLASAAEKKEARVTQIFHEVRLLAPQAAPRPATVNDNVRDGTAVRTGGDSRAELTFGDLTITRLGANTIFSLGGGLRTYDLSSGAILMYAPKEVGTVRINTSTAIASVTGFTALYETHSKSWNKFILLEGDGSVSLKRHTGQTRNLHSGQMIIFPYNAVTLPAVQDIDSCKVIDKALLITQFRRLPSWNLLLEVCRRQHEELPSSQLIDPTSQRVIDQSINARPTPPTTPRPRGDGDLKPH